MAHENLETRVINMAKHFDSLLSDTNERFSKLETGLTTSNKSTLEKVAQLDKQVTEFAKNRKQELKDITLGLEGKFDSWLNNYVKVSSIREMSKRSDVDEDFGHMQNVVFEFRHFYDAQSVIYSSSLLMKKWNLYRHGESNANWIHFQRFRHTSPIMVRILNEVQMLYNANKNSTADELIDRVGPQVQTLFKLGAVFEPMVLNNINLIMLEKLRGVDSFMSLLLYYRKIFSEPSILN